jgi:hypothetical protein
VDRVRQQPRIPESPRACSVRRDGIRISYGSLVEVCRPRAIEHVSTDDLPGSGGFPSGRARYGLERVLKKRRLPAERSPGQAQARKRADFPPKGPLATHMWTSTGRILGRELTWNSPKHVPAVTGDEH